MREPFCFFIHLCSELVLEEVENLFGYRLSWSTVANVALEFVLILGYFRQLDVGFFQQRLGIILVNTWVRSLSSSIHV
jgi:hypothetical protein